MSLRHSPWRDTSQGSSRGNSHPNSRNQRDSSTNSDTASSRRGRSPAARDTGLKVKLPGVGRGRGIPPPANPPKADRVPSSKGWAGNPNDRPQSMETGGSESCSDSASEQTGPWPYAGHLPGEGPVPRGVDTVVLLSGEKVYRGTPEQPILVYEHCKAENQRNNQKFLLWRLEHVEDERECMKNREPLNLIPTPQFQQLPHLPDWAAPNGWDFWGHPWAYMDAPAGHSTVGVKSKEGRAWVTIAVIVRLDREEQYLPDQNVAKSASVAGTLARKTRVFNEDGSIHEDKKKKVMPFAAAQTLYPCGWGPNRCEAVHGLLKCWHSFRANRVGQRLNPPMPKGDVTLKAMIGQIHHGNPSWHLNGVRAQGTPRGPAPIVGA